MLHVLNGDATFAALKPLALPGRALVWRDATLEGPVPNGLASDADWRERARWLAAHAGLVARDFEAGAAAFRRDLGSAKEREEVVLWFEEDLFCQLPLCHLLAVARPEGDAPWSVICPSEKLGVSPPDVLARRFEERRPADDALVALARRAWAAYASSDPRAVLALVEEGTPEWPLLARGLRLHLGRFPAPRDGLSTLQRTILANLASDGSDAVPFREHFGRLSRAPLVQDLGVGDHDVALEWWRLASCADPLIELEGAARELRPGTIEACARWSASLTPTGARVLAGDVDHVARNPSDVWLGGVHVRPGNVWRYDEASGTLAAPAG